MAQLSVLGDIELQPIEFLAGDESVSEAQAIIQSVIEAGFAEADAQLAAARAKEFEKWREDMLGLLVLSGFLALPLLAAKYPDQVLPTLRWLERTFRKNSTPEGGSTAKAPPETEASSATSSGPPRRWRKNPAPPAGSEPERLNPIDTKPSVAQKSMGGNTETRDLGPFDEVQISFP